VGLIEGDGWFSVSKKGKYIMYEFGIELSIRDVQLIYKIKDVLGVGTVFFRERERKFNKDKCDINKANSKEKANMVMYRIRNKSHLKNIIIPIFDKYPFFSNKQYDYIRFRTLLLSNVIYSKDLINYVRPNILLNSVESIIKSSYFSAWLIGFIEAESSFCIYKPVSDTSFIASFEISQTDGEVIILAIKKYFKFTQNLRKDNTNNFKIKVSSVRAVENVIYFMRKAPIRLLGYKKMQYISWLSKLRKIPRYYSKINIPLSY
jgi:LAGLIDADG endonuclease